MSGVQKHATAHALPNKCATYLCTWTSRCQIKSAFSSLMSCQITSAFCMQNLSKQPVLPLLTERCEYNAVLGRAHQAVNVHGVLNRPLLYSLLQVLQHQMPGLVGYSVPTKPALPVLILGWQALKRWPGVPLISVAPGKARQEGTDATPRSCGEVLGENPSRTRSHELRGCRRNAMPANYGSRDS